MPGDDRDIERLCINTIRTLAIDAIQRANSGHPGLPLGAAPAAYVLWQRHLRHNPRDPAWPDRDRFVLSAGHGSMLLYGLLYLTGYDLSLDDILAFRQWGSRTPGHPEALLTPGVEATTGPLGQGTANAVGMAIAERMLAHRFNRPGHTIVDHHTYVLASDGDMMEGVSAEAASFAGHARLGKLIMIYDCNHVSLDGPTSLTFSREDVAARYAAYGWQVLHVPDGNTNLDAIDAALTAARADTSRPSLIIVETTIGYGSPNRQGTSAAHGSPLGVEEVALTKRALGWDPDRHFHVPEAALAHFRTALERGARHQADWQRRFEAWAAAHPDLAHEWHCARRGELPEGWDAGLPVWTPGDSVPTRVAAGKTMNAIAAHVPWLVGGDADLSSSTQAAIAGGGSFDGQTGAGRNIHFGVREHAMAAAVNGMAYHGGLRPFASTFFCFSDYLRPALRIAAMDRLPVIYFWSHDSIGVGEDGPTHQPVEQLMSLRLTPGLTVIRAADAVEATEAWRWIMTHRDGPVALILTRQKVPVLDRSRAVQGAGLAQGAYVIAEADGGTRPDAILIATGSEVAVALEARALLAAEGMRVRVVSMPSWEIFATQSAEYRESVLPQAVTARVSVEAGVTLGWERWIGARGRAIGIDRFGRSAPAPVLFEKFGFTAENVARVTREVLGR